MDDPTKLAAVGLSGVIVVIMVLSMLIGLNSAQETLTSQAFGHGNLRLCGIYLNRGRFILLAFYIPFAAIAAAFSEKILVAFGQDEEVSHLTNVYVWAALPAVIFYSQYDLYKRWLACQRITFVPMVAMFIGTSLHVPFCYLYVKYFDLGLIGLGVASSSKDLIILISVMIYGNCSA